MSPVQWGVTGVMILGLALVVFALKKQAAAIAVRTPAPPPKSELSSLHAEMQEMTRTLIGELDRKTRDLEQVIVAADQRIRTLEALSRTSADAPATTEPAAFVEPKDPMWARVQELADAGYTPVEIGQAVGCPTGQIELMLALRRAGH